MNAQAKAELRKAALAAREKSGGDQAAITRNLTNALLPYNGQILSGYWPMRGEASPIPAMKVRVGPTCLPVVVGKALPLIFREWYDGPLDAGPFGTSHPPETAPELTPSILIVPLSAFDRLGNRIGYGGGYYDRTLEQLRQNSPAVAIGLAFSSQEVDSIPSEGFDQPLDMIVTCHETIIPTPSRRV